MEIRKDDISTTMADFLNRDNIVFDDACFPSKIKLRSESYENFNLNKFNYPVSSIVSGIVDTNIEDNGWSYTIVGDKAFYTDEEKAIKLKQEKFARLCKNVGIEIDEYEEQPVVISIPSTDQEITSYVSEDIPITIPSEEYQSVEEDKNVNEEIDLNIYPSLEKNEEITVIPVEEPKEETQIGSNNDDKLYSELSVEANEVLLMKAKLDETKNEYEAVQENSTKQIEESYSNLFSKSDEYEETQNSLEDKKKEESEIDRKLQEAREKQAEVIKLFAEKTKQEIETTKEAIQEVNDSTNQILEENNNNISYFDEAIQSSNNEISTINSRILDKQAIIESMMGTFDDQVQEEPVRRVA